MPGAGKSEATKYLKTKKIPFVRFGQITDDALKSLGLPMNQTNERMIREKLRKDFGMAAYAIKSKPNIDIFLKNHDVIVLDGLYSWEEYIFLKKQYPDLILIHVFAEPPKRYERLSKRTVRPLSIEEAEKRDFAELEKLNKGGPIAMADYIVVNNGEDMDEFYNSIDIVLKRLDIKK